MDKEIALRSPFEGRDERTRSLVRAYAASPFNTVDFSLPRTSAHKKSTDRSSYKNATGKRVRNSNLVTQSLDQGRYKTEAQKAQSIKVLGSNIPKTSGDSPVVNYSSIDLPQIKATESKGTTGAV